MGAKYTTQTQTGYNSSPPPDDGSVQASNKVSWATMVKTKIGDPVLTLAQAINTALVTFTNFGSRAVSATDSVAAADHMKSLELTGTFTESLPDATATGAGFIVTLRNISTGVITVALVTATDTLEGTANGTLLLAPGQFVTVKTNAGATGYYVISGSYSGSTTFTLTGCTTSPTYVGKWVKNGPKVTMSFPGTSVWTGTSNTTSKTLTGMPAALFPSGTLYVVGMSSDNSGATVPAQYRVRSTGVIEMYPDITGLNWTNSGTAGGNIPMMSWTVA